MLSLDSMLESPELTTHTFLEECLTSCLECQMGLATFDMDYDRAIKHPQIWTMLCDLHSPWMRGKMDPNYLPSIRVDIARLTTEVALLPSYEDIINRMANGEDMLRREVIDQERFETRFAELEAMLRKREELQDDLTYWRSMLVRAASDTFLDREV